MRHTSVPFPTFVSSRSTRFYERRSAFGLAAGMMRTSDLVTNYRFPTPLTSKKCR
jgi:hypothetical protein